MVSSGNNRKRKLPGLVLCESFAALQKIAASTTCWCSGQRMFSTDHSVGEIYLLSRNYLAELMSVFLPGLLDKSAQKPLSACGYSVPL